MRWFVDTLLPSDRLDPWINLGLLVVGIAYTVFAGFQWLAIRRQAKIGDRAAKAATDANRIASEALVITLRARITIKAVHIFTEQGKDGVVTRGLEFTVANTGDTPATGMRKVLRRAVAEVGDITIKRMDPLGEPNPENTDETIDPHSEKTYDQPLHLPYEPGKGPIATKEELDAVRRGEKNIQIGVCVVYWDGFGNKRTTERWQVYNPTLHTWERVFLYQE